ncbi:MAG: hypothetical protein QOF48_2658 [Verrucomicrobiota bacterium]|jgi:hypothetical protein
MRQGYWNPMLDCRVPTLIHLAFVMAIPVLFSGCISTDEAGSRGVKLSDAMAASAKNDPRDLGGKNHPDNDPDVEGTATVGTRGSSSFVGVSYDNSEYAWQVPVDVSYSIPFHSDIQGITHFTLTPVSFEDDQNFFALLVGGAIVDLKSGTLPAAGIERPWMLEAGLGYRHYLNSSRQAFSPYIAGSIEYALLGWDYRHSIVAGGDRIRADALNGAEGSVAFGISTRRDSHFSVFSEVGVGGTVFFGPTREGFSNDVFNNFGFFFIKAGLSVKF